MSSTLFALLSLSVWLFASLAWAADDNVIELRTYRLPVHRSDCEQRFRPAPSTSRNGLPEFYNRLYYLGTDLGHIAYPNLRLQRLQPSPLDLNAIAPFRYNFSDDPRVGVTSPMLNAQLSFFPADVKLAMSHDQSLIFAGVQRLPLLSELQLLQQAVDDLALNPPNPTSIMGLKIPELEARRWRLADAENRVNMKSLNVYEAATGVPVFQASLSSFARRIAFVRAIPNPKSGEPDLIAVGLTHTGSDVDCVDIFSMRLKRRVAWLRLANYFRSSRLLDEVSVSEDGQEIILAVKKGERKVYFRERLDTAFKNEANPAFAVKPRDRQQEYVNPLPIAIAPTDDFNSQTRDLVHVGFVAGRLLSVDRSGNVRWHERRFDSVGKKSFTITIEGETQIAVSNDSSLLAAVPKTTNAEHPGSVYVYTNGELASSLPLATRIPPGSELVDAQITRGSIRVLGTNGSAFRGSKVQVTYMTPYLTPSYETKLLTRLVWIDRGAGFEIFDQHDATFDFTPIL